MTIIALCPATIALTPPRPRQTPSLLCALGPPRPHQLSMRWKPSVRLGSRRGVSFKEGTMRHRLSLHSSDPWSSVRCVSQALCSRQRRAFTSKLLDVRKVTEKMYKIDDHLAYDSRSNPCAVVASRRVASRRVASVRSHRPSACVLLVVPSLVSPPTLIF